MAEVDLWVRQLMCYTTPVEKLLPKRARLTDTLTIPYMCPNVHAWSSNEHILFMKPSQCPNEPATEKIICEVTIHKQSTVTGLPLMGMCKE